MPPTTKEDFDIHMRGSLEGIGAVLQEDDGYIKVSRIIPGGAADRQKELQAEDIILMVAQGAAEPVDIVDMRIRDAVELIRGDKGSEVWLTVKKPDGVVTHIKIIRDVVQLEETFAKSAVMPETDGKGVYGYMKIPSFYRDFENTRDGGDGRNVTDDVRQELKDLEAKNIKGLILDLRNNGGGALVDAVKIAGLFIKYGPVVQVKTSGEEPEVLYDNDPEIQYDGPLVVLVNKFSASASEILAGALQDYNRAVVVGADHSYGKGTVQTLLNLDDYMPFMGFNLSQYKPMGALKMTTQKFYRISGESTQHKGVVPDIILPDRFKFVEAGEQYLENSLEWDRIDPVSFTPWHNLPDAANLKSLSEKRVSTDDDFKEIVKEAEEAKKRQEETIVHVNIDYLKSEMERLKELMKGNAHSEMGGQGELGQKGKDSDKELSKEEEGKMFIEQLREDPYVVESLHLLSDIAS
jgi:carboxyl-terminal processing protease